MTSKWGAWLLPLSLLAGCDNAKDLPLLGRYVAKNVCAAIWQEGYLPQAASDYVSNVAPLIQNSWQVKLQDNGAVAVDNFWFPWVSIQRAAPDPAGDCRNL